MGNDSDSPREKEPSDHIHTTVTTHHDEFHGPEIDKTVSGIAMHMEASRTAEEKKAEKRFVLKVDMVILPLITSLYLLASMVCNPPQPSRCCRQS